MRWIDARSKMGDKNVNNSGFPTEYQRVSLTESEIDPSRRMSDTVRQQEGRRIWRVRCAPANIKFFIPVATVGLTVSA